VLDDVLDDLISVETARRDFGVVLTPALTIDTDATALARAAPLLSTGPVHAPDHRATILDAFSLCAMQSYHLSNT
jgi:hypothetical protein